MTACASCGHARSFHSAGVYPPCCWRNYPKHSSLSGEACPCKGYTTPEKVVA